MYQVGNLNQTKVQGIVSLKVPANEEYMQLQLLPGAGIGHLDGALNKIGVCHKQIYQFQFH